MQKIEVHESLAGVNPAPLTLALVAASAHEKTELNHRKGLNPLIDMLATSNPAVAIEKLLHQSLLATVEVGFWKGDMPNSVGIYTATPDVQVYGVDQDGTPESQLEVFDGVLVDAFVHVEEGELKTREEENLFRFEVYKTLTQKAIESGLEICDNIAALERNQPPAGSSRFIGSKKLGSVFKREISNIHPMENALAMSSFMLDRAITGYHFRTDSSNLRGAYSRLHVIGVDNS